MESSIFDEKKILKNQNKTNKILIISAKFPKGNIKKKKIYKNEARVFQSKLADNKYFIQESDE